MPSKSRTSCEESERRSKQEHSKEQHVWPRTEHGHEARSEASTKTSTQRVPSGSRTPGLEVRPCVRCFFLLCQWLYRLFALFALQIFATHPPDWKKLHEKTGSTLISHHRSTPATLVSPSHVTALGDLQQPGKHAA